MNNSNPTFDGLHLAAAVMETCYDLGSFSISAVGPLAEIAGIPLTTAARAMATIQEAGYIKVVNPQGEAVDFPSPLPGYNILLTDKGRQEVLRCRILDNGFDPNNN